MTSGGGDRDSEAQASEEAEQLIMNAEQGVRSPRQRLSRTHSHSHPTTAEVRLQAMWSSLGGKTRLLVGTLRAPAHALFTSTIIVLNLYDCCTGTSRHDV